MCGIIGYTGYRQALPVLLKGLERLEYRGYDSAGVALLQEEITVLKKAGKVRDLEEEASGMDLGAHTGIGHTRWATHGEPNDRNAHPHVSQSGSLAMVHNGIIENYAQLKEELLAKGYRFKSDTDTEVLLNLIEDTWQSQQGSLEQAVSTSLNNVTGAYCILLVAVKKPDKIIAAKKGAPLVIGVGQGEYFLASDTSALIEYTKDVVYVNDDEIAVIVPDRLIIKHVKNGELTPVISRLDMQLESIEKKGFAHFMLKEIFEQPESMADCLRGRLPEGVGEIAMREIDEHINRLIDANRIIIVACGTSWHAGLIGEYLIEELCRIPVEVDYASEFRYRDPVLREGDVIIAISQSGETADTLVALESAKEKGAFVFGIVNVAGSSIGRLSDAVSYTYSGPEMGVASTKSFTGQLAVLAMIAMKIAKAKGTIDDNRYNQLLSELHAIPMKIAEIRNDASNIKRIAEKYLDATDFLLLGRGNNFPVALEGALKLKEITYIHAEGYPAAEMKHGPIALVDRRLPVLFIATQSSNYEKIISNIQEIRARKGMIIAIATKGDDMIASLADDVIFVPPCCETLTPLLSVIPLQLLSYYSGIAKGLDVDKPRNLAKSVTVE